MAVIRDVMPAFELFQPTSVEDTLGLLEQHGASAWLLAGGLDTFDWLKDRSKRTDVVIDLSQVSELRGIREVDGGLEIGALTTLTEVVKHPVVREKFGLGDEEAQALVAVADQAAAGATDDYQFTSLINQHLSAAQKERIVEYLWEVAYADGSAAPYEEHFVRKIAELLYVSHGAFLMAKERARTRAG